MIDTGARPTHEDLQGNIVGGWNRCGDAAASCPGAAWLRRQPLALAARVLPALALAV